MLLLRRRTFFSREYDVVIGGASAGELVRARFKAEAELSLESRRFRMRRHGTFKGTYTLHEGDELVLEVRRTRVVPARLEFRFEDRNYEVNHRGWFSHTLKLEADGVSLGSARAEIGWKGGAIVELPDHLPHPVQAFLGWIALCRRDERKRH
ncbi:MAG: hypothetical protein KC591_16350 [Gemmatimonadetes bacterium]|nr:hypothetical protein [Gemmatimonadota bacterium]